MRTTLTLDPDVYEAARALARDTHRPLGAVVSDLARRGLRPRPTRDEDGLPVFDVPDDAEVIPADRARRLLASEGTD